jgi:hypothetical protein
MRFIAGALVVLAGSLLWGMATLAVSWIYMAGGNRGSADVATWGGVTVLGVGFLILFLAHRRNE